jgi:amidase
MTSSGDDDAISLAVSIATGELSPLEAVDDAIAAIERMNPSLNAVIRERFEAARAEAAATPTGAFAGVPLLLKDLGGTIAGESHHQGNQLLKRLDWRADVDSPIASRFLAGGFIVLGRTNTPEFGATPTTQPLAYGATRNPWDLEHSPSGSSGGSATAVASGMVRVAHANDFGGSIRMPAAWCGLIGLKATRGRVSTHPAPPGAQAELAVTRSLRDTAALLDVLAGPAGDDPPLPLDPMPWRDALSGDPGRRRIGLLVDVDGVGRLDDRCREAAHDAALVLAAAGHEVVELPSSFLADDRWDECWRVVRAKGSAARRDVLVQLAGRPLTTDDAEPLLLAFAEEAASISDEVHREAGEWQLAYRDGVADRWRALGLDAMVTPSTGIAPRTTAEMQASADDPIASYEVYRRVGCFAGPWNMVGFPALTLPWWTPSEGLPIGVQVVGGWASEGLVLQLARQLTEAEPERTRVRTAPG